mgnify:CR=1 FL=1
MPTMVRPRSFDVIFEVCFENGLPQVMEKIIPIKTASPGAQFFAGDQIHGTAKNAKAMVMKQIFLITVFIAVFEKE